MSLIEKTKYYYSEKNKNCAEAILLASNEVFGFGLSEDCAKIVMGFGGGLGCGKLCGSLPGIRLHRKNRFGRFFCVPGRRKIRMEP